MLFYKLLQMTKQLKIIRNQAMLLDKHMQSEFSHGITTKQIQRSTVKLLAAVKQFMGVYHIVYCLDISLSRNRLNSADFINNIITIKQINLIQSKSNIGKVLQIIVCFLLPLTKSLFTQVLSQRRRRCNFTKCLSPSQFIPAEGFQRGETQVYVSGKGFNTNGKGMNVYFGPYECDIVPQKSTINTVVCKTSPMQKGKKKSNLPLSVYMVNSLPATCQTRKCLFSYLSNQTLEEQQQTRILVQYTPVHKLTCTSPTQYDNGGAVCELCDGLQNSPGTAAANRKACNCNPTFVWNSTSNACECPQNFVLLGSQCLACAPLKNKYGMGFSAGLSSCECKNSDFVFNANTFSCVCKESTIPTIKRELLLLHSQFVFSVK